MSTIRKGDVVTVNARVHTARRVKPLKANGETLLHEPERGETKTCLFRIPCVPWQGLVIGWSHLQTGSYHDGVYDDWPHLSCDKGHVVLMVVPMDTERYLRPVTVLEEDVGRERYRIHSDGSLSKTASRKTNSNQGGKRC
jgi:hypothetical protein